jgi:cysteine synthase A
VSRYAVFADFARTKAPTSKKLMPIVPNLDFYPALLYDTELLCCGDILFVNLLRSIMTKKIYENILEKIGKTPLVRINKLNTGKAEILAKLESFNPSGSVKDRVAVAMIEAAEREGKLGANPVIIEPTSGNTGVGLALAAAVKGYRLILTMPDSAGLEFRKMLQAYGAELLLTDGSLGMKGAVDAAHKLASHIPNAFLPHQFENLANPAYHRATTAEEIWADTDGKVDVFIAGVGTGGTLTGVGELLKERNPAVKIIAVEPAESPVLSGGCVCSHRIRGLGAGFVPAVLNTGIIDEIMTVRSEQAGATARAAATEEGLLVGISSGAALHAALTLSKHPDLAGKRIVTVLPDSGGRYLSGWLFNS